MNNTWAEQCRIWELILVKVENFAPQPSSSSIPAGPGSTSTPPYEQNPGKKRCTCSHVTTEPGDGGYGTTVVEVTTVTTQGKYRLDN